MIYLFSHEILSFQLYKFFIDQVTLFIIILNFCFI